MTEDAPWPSVRLRLTSETPEMRPGPVDGLGGGETRDMVKLYTLYTAVHLYSAALLLLWALVLYNLNPTINCRRFSLFTHTAGHNTIKPAAGVLAERREIKENYFSLQTVSLSNAGGLSTGLSI